MADVFMEMPWSEVRNAGHCPGAASYRGAQLFFAFDTADASRLTAAKR